MAAAGDLTQFLYTINGVLTGDGGAAEQGELDGAHATEGPEGEVMESTRMARLWAAMAQHVIREEELEAPKAAVAG